MTLGWIPDSARGLLAGSHGRMTLEGLLRQIAAALTAQRAGPDNMRGRHNADGYGFLAPFTSQDRLRLGFQVHHVSQFRRMKNECLVGTAKTAEELH
jgi:hypothetical protein